MPGARLTAHSTPANTATGLDASMYVPVRSSPIDRVSSCSTSPSSSWKVWVSPGFIAGTPAPAMMCVDAVTMTLVPSTVPTMLALEREMSAPVKSNEVAGSGCGQVRR